jgi:hypothetical protein
VKSIVVHTKANISKIGAQNIDAEQKPKDYGWLSGLDNEGVVELRARVDAELAKRGVTFDVGTLGEKLCIGFFNSTPSLPKLLMGPRGAKNVDALSRDGNRYSIKAYMKAKKTGTIYPDREDPERQLFEYLLVVRLDERYQLEAIYRFSWKTFLKLRAWDKRMNAWYLPLSSKNLKQGEALFERRSNSSTGALR